MSRSHLDVPNSSVWIFEDRVSGEIVRAVVSSKFKTTEGVFCALRNAASDQPLGNVHFSELIERVK